MSAPTEIELKFVVTPEAARSLQENLLGGGERHDLRSIYFDTKDQALQLSGTALRLRSVEEGWVQTFKAGGAGAVERIEDETPAPEGRLDLAAFSEATKLRLPSGSEKDLRPVFETRVERRTVRLSSDADTVVEAALDQGAVQAGERTAPIRELELELKAGPLPALFADARDIALRPGVTLSLSSKAERGYRLAAGHLDRAVRFEPPRLDFAGPASAGFQALALAALHQLCANAEGLRKRESPEAVHQARIGLRRLRTYFGAFKRWTADTRRPAIQAALKRLTALFEDARALDVFAWESFKPLARHEPGASEFGHALLAARAAVYGRLRASLEGPAFAADVFDILEWLVCGPWRDALALTPEAEGDLAAAARRLLSHRWRVLLRRGRRLSWTDPRARHKLRIQVKKMRYLGDAFQARGGRTRRALKRLQSELGALNDIATARDAARLALVLADRDAAFAAGAVVGERRAAARSRLKAARRAFRKLARRDPPRAD